MFCHVFSFQSLKPRFGAPAKLLGGGRTAVLFYAGDFNSISEFESQGSQKFLFLNAVAYHKNFWLKFASEFIP